MVKKLPLSVISALGLTLSLMVAGCEKGTVSPSPSPSQQTIGEETQEPEKVNKFKVNRKSSELPEVISRQDAWKDAKIKSFDAVLPDGRAWAPITLTDDGLIAGAVPTQKPVTKPLDLIVYDPKTDTYEVISTLSGTSQAIGVSLNEKWIVWSESLDNTSYVNWKMHVYDRSTKQDRIVAESFKDEIGRGFDGPLWMPKLYGDEFVWSPSVGKPTPELGVQVVVKKYNILTDKTTDLAKPGGNPALSKDFALWIGRDDQTNDGALFWNKGGKNQQITEGKSISHFATDGESIAWSGLQRGSQEHWELALIDQQGTERLLKSTRSEDALQFLTMGNRILGWKANDKVQVYDRKLDKVVTLEEKDAEYSAVHVTNNYLFWTTPIPQTEEERRQAKLNGIYPTRIHLLDLQSLK